MSTDNRSGAALSAQKSYADIIAEMRKYRDLVITGKKYADRLEEAHKRERGDCAKLREALEAIISGYEKADLCDMNYGEWCHDPANVCVNVPLCKAIHEARAALAAPPRNCDVLKLEEGHPGDIADQVWRAYKHSHMGSYLDVCDLLRCIGWLFAPATEKEGGKDADQ